jgi:hypothetical protein
MPPFMLRLGINTEHAFSALLFNYSQLSQAPKVLRSALSAVRSTRLAIGCHAQA